MRIDPSTVLAPSEEFLAEALPLSQHDRVLRAAVARAFQGFSPVAQLEAFHDWLTHLAVAPGKQAELAAKAMRKWHRLMLWSIEAAAQRADPCIEPLPQDHRFDNPAWQQWPYNFIYQSFLLMQQWWWNATTGVKGVTKHHEQMVTFVMRQWLDMASPSNFLLTNPEAMQKTLEQGGTNLWKGAYNRWRDYVGQVAGRRPDGADQWQVGKDVAITPGKVVMRNHLIELIQYTPTTAEVWKEPVLVVPSWIMKYYILDLQPQNSMVKYLVDQGHTVFAISWRNPDIRDRNLGMDDYLKVGVLAAIDAVKRILPERDVHTVGYCLGGTFLSIVAAYMAREN
nr:alpha/beta fold hydrolase [Burkholderiales bacterium]